MTTPKLIECKRNDSDGNSGRMLAFYCPGCGHYHSYIIESQKRPCWQWNGSMDKPTFTPSLLNHIPARDSMPEHRCHLFVTDGQIRYCGDCTHELAGQTVEMQDEE